MEYSAGIVYRIIKTHIHGVMCKWHEDDVLKDWFRYKNSRISHVHVNVQCFVQTVNVIFWSEH